MRWSDFVYGYGNATQEDVREAIIEGQIKQVERVAAESDEDAAPDDDDEMVPVYAIENEGVWSIYHAETCQLLETVWGNQHDMVQHCIDREWDLRDGPLSAY